MNQQRAVAFLNILGFKNMISNNSSEELAGKYEKLVKFAESRSRPIVASLFPDDNQNSTCYIQSIFSDSIILVSKDSSFESCLKMLIYAWSLLQYMTAARIPVRGGISYGDFYMNQKTNVFLGKALTDAYLLESKQQWIGVSICNDLFDAFPQLEDMTNGYGGLCNILFPKYAVPLKNGTKENYHVLNWRFNLIVQKGTKSLFKSDGSSDVEEKIKNTLVFVEKIIRDDKIYASINSLPVGLVPFYVGNKKPPFPPPFPHGDDL